MASKVASFQSVTASKSDEWVPIRPGTDGALALGLAAVIAREELFDERFIREKTVGFDRWRDRCHHWALD